MRITSGRHKGRTLEVVALRDPAFIGGLLASKPGTETGNRLQTEARRLVEAFDRRVFHLRCVGQGCERPATRCTIYKGDILSPWWWRCDTCDPRRYGAGADMIRIVRTYQDRSTSPCPSATRRSRGTSSGRWRRPRG